MNKSQFLNASLSQLEELTSICRTRWSRYFNGQSMTLRTLEKASKGLDMPSSEVFSAIEERKHKPKLTKTSA